MNTIGINNFTTTGVENKVQSESKTENTQKNQNPVNDNVELGSQNENIPIGVHKKYLFMNYIAADCNLVEAQLRNIDNMELAGSDENTHIVALIDVGPSPNPMENSWGGARTFYVTKDDTQEKIKSPVVADHGGFVNMIDPKTLTNFIVDNVKKFPADYVVLMLNDHGAAFRGAMSDVSQAGGKQMSVPEIRKALEEAEKVTGKKIDILGFDACLMADTQVAYELKDNANILLASEETEGATGWTYEPILTNHMTTALKDIQRDMRNRIDVSPEEFAKKVVKECEKHQDDIETLSATDLTKMSLLKNSIDGFSKAIIETNDKDSVRAAIVNSDCFAGGWSYYKDIHDLYMIADAVTSTTKDEKLKTAAEDIKKVFSEAVFANQTNKETHPGCKGLTIYAPLVSANDFFTMFNYNSLKFGKETEWRKAVTSLEQKPTMETVKEDGKAMWNIA